MGDDEEHEAYGAMVHRALVEQSQGRDHHREIVARLTADLAASQRDRAKMARDLIELDAKLAKAREALRPFAAFELWTDAYPDGPLNATTWDRHVNPEWISFARSVIEEIGEAAIDQLGTLRNQLAQARADLAAAKADRKGCVKRADGFLDELAQARAELAAAQKWKDDFCMDYRIKCDEETKKLRAELAAANAHAAELAAALRPFVNLHLVGCGDGDTFTISPPTGEQINRACAALTKGGDNG